MITRKYGELYRDPDNGEGLDLSRSQALREAEAEAELPVHDRHQLWLKKKEMVGWCCFHLELGGLERGRGRDVNGMRLSSQLIAFLSTAAPIRAATRARA